jgi:plasmid stability protein
VAQLIVRNVDPEVVHRLKLRAAQHGRSMEAEQREILRQALLTSEPGVTLKALLLATPPMGDDTDFARPWIKGVRSSCELPPRYKCPLGAAERPARQSTCGSLVCTCPRSRHRNCSGGNALTRPRMGWHTFFAGRFPRTFL